MEAARDLPHDDLASRDWQEYADACLCHDRTEPCVSHAYDLAHSDDRVLAATASTTLSLLSGDIGFD